MRSEARENRLLVVSGILLFAALAVLSVFLIAGESRRSRILMEYEADRLATALVESPSQSGSDLDRRILGFGLYDRAGGLVSSFGSAPETIDPSDATAPFAYDEKGKTLSFARPLGMAWMRRNMLGQRKGQGDFQRGMWQMMGEGGHAQGYVYLSLDVSNYLRRRALLGVSAYAVPALIALLGALFIRLVSNNAKLRKSAQERETLARLGEGARTLAHEIRNPLGAIRIQTGLLRQRLPGEGAPELDAIDEETERLNLLSRRVSDFLKNPRGSPVRVELVSYLSELAGRSPYAPRFSSKLESAFVLFDPELLRSCLDNLLRNAAESYDSGESALCAADAGVSREIELVLEREGASASISVLDRGSGIAPEAMGKVFDPFYTDKLGGTGLGLPLAKRFVEAAGGSLRLSPRQGGGTVARIQLPACEEER
jgi:Signal transduction histidine kinase